MSAGGVRARGRTLNGSVDVRERRWDEKGRDDVLLRRCITCGAPSIQGLCRTCMSPKRTKTTGAETYYVFTEKELKRVPNQKYCTCGECERLRTRKPKTRVFGWPTGGKP